MAIRTVVTRGYGNGTYNGTIPLVVTRGYGIGEPPTVAIYTANVMFNPTPVASLLANLALDADVISNPTPTKEVNSG